MVVVLPDLAHTAPHHAALPSLLRFCRHTPCLSVCTISTQMSTNDKKLREVYNTYARKHSMHGSASVLGVRVRVVQRCVWASRSRPMVARQALPSAPLP